MTKDEFLAIVKDRRPFTAEELADLRKNGSPVLFPVVNDMQQVEQLIPLGIGVGYKDPTEADSEEQAKQELVRAQLASSRYLRTAIALLKRAEPFLFNAPLVGVLDVHAAVKDFLIEFENAPTLRDRVFEALDNAAQNDYNEWLMTASVGDIVDDLQRYNPDLEDSIEEGDEDCDIMPHVQEWIRIRKAENSLRT